MFRPFAEPQQRPLAILSTAQLLPFVTYGIVNPMGPTLSGICLALDHDQELSEVLSFYLNPFAQDVVALGQMDLPEDRSDLVDEVAGIIEQCELFSEARFTLAIPHQTLSPHDMKRILILLLSRAERVGAQLERIRRFWGNPVDRVSAEMREPSTPSDVTPKVLKEYVELISDMDHTKPEFAAFMTAWSGSINFVKGSKLEAMPATQFLAILERLV